MQLLLNSRAYSVQEAVLLLGLSNLLILSVYPSSQSAFRGKMDMLSQLGIAFNPKLEISKQQWTRLVTELSGDLIRKSLPAESVCPRLLRPPLPLQGGSRCNPRAQPLGAVACCALFLLTCGLLMTSSHYSKAS